eukprot:1033339-Alexandrium_andersonii.AAC.1
MAPARYCGRRRQLGLAPAERHLGAASSYSGRRLVGVHGRFPSAHAGCSAGVCRREQLAALGSSPGPLGGRPLESELE